MRHGRNQEGHIREEIIIISLLRYAKLSNHNSSRLKQMQRTSTPEIDHAKKRHILQQIYFLPATLAAALVTLAALSIFLTDLMTPTATVCLMSRTAKRPRGA
jgi:hypothetical protein